MSKSKQEPSALQVVDATAFFLALWFVYSVINNARDLVELNTKNAPASFAFILAIILVAWSWNKKKNKLSAINIITLTIVVTAAVIWSLALSTRGSY